MVYINEWFPNPAGKDDGEFVELYNSGNGAVSLGGYSLSIGAKKKFSLSGYSIQPGGYLLLQKAQTKLTLKNTDGGLWLYGPGGSLIDHGAFAGVAQVGQSFSREYLGGDDHVAGAEVQAFAWTTPTPGIKNKMVDTAVIERNYQQGVSFAKAMSPMEFLGSMIGTAAALVGIFIYVIQKNEDLQKLFFGRNEEVR